MFQKITTLLLICLPGFLFGQSVEAQLKATQQQLNNLQHRFGQLQKSVDDLLWYEKINDIAFMDKVVLTGPPLGEDKAMALGSYDAHYKTNPYKIYTYIFFPHDVEEGKERPLLVLPHGGVHSDFKSTLYAHIVRELISQGYIVVAPEYRGSTGYGQRYYQAIDYGGLEIQDVKACRDFMLDNYADLVDADRVGILGWSHGGLITLMNLFEYPDAYKVGYAGVPVSDLIYRMGNKTQRYRDLYEVDYHIGKSANEAPDEYRRRSPTWNAEKLQTPLLIHTNTNDSDVTVGEVETLINALKAADKDFEYEIYEGMPGGHTFDRIDIKSAKEIRLKVYKFLGEYLKPPKPFKNVRQLQKAGYRY